MQSQKKTSPALEKTAQIHRQVIPKPSRDRMGMNCTNSSMMAHKNQISDQQTTLTA